MASGATGKIKLIFEFIRLLALYYRWNTLSHFYMKEKVVKLRRSMRNPYKNK